MQFWKKDKPPVSEHVEPGMKDESSSSNPIKFSEEPVFGTSSIPRTDTSAKGDESQGEFVMHPAVFSSKKEEASSESKAAPTPVPAETKNSAPDAKQKEESPASAEKTKPDVPKKKRFTLFGKKKDKDQAEAPVSDEDLANRQKWITARRRFVGALVLLVTAAVAVPLLMDKEPPPTEVTIPLRIPKESNVEVSNITIPTVIRPESADIPPKSQEVAPPKVPKPAEKAAPAPKTPAAPTQVAAKQDNPPAPKKPEVKNEPKKPEPPKPEAKEKAPVLTKGQFYIQLAALSNEKRASDMVSKAKSAGLNCFLSPINTKKGKVFRVQCGPYKTRQQGSDASAKLALSGLSAGKVLQVK